MTSRNGYGLAWHLRDARRSLAFIIACRPLRWYGWACAFWAALQAVLAVTLADGGYGWAAAGLALAAGVLLGADAARGAKLDCVIPRREAPRP